MKTAPANALCSRIGHFLDLDAGDKKERSSR
jgi:hypothetical protein